MEHDHSGSMRFDTDDEFHKVPLTVLPGYTLSVGPGSSEGDNDGQNRKTNIGSCHFIVILFEVKN